MSNVYNSALDAVPINCHINYSQILNLFEPKIFSRHASHTIKRKYDQLGFYILVDSEVDLGEFGM